MEERERRTAPRTTLTASRAAWVRGLRAVHLLDLSLTGAQLEHLGVFRPGAPCALDLPPPATGLSLPAQVVWCTIIGRKRMLGGESHLVARSGFRFVTLTAGQVTALAATLQLNRLLTSRRNLGETFNL